MLSPNSPAHIVKDEASSSLYEVNLRRILTTLRNVSPEIYDQKRKSYFNSCHSSTAFQSLDHFPTTVNVELVNKCNYKCSMCYTVNHEGPATVLDFEVYKRVIDECADNGLLSLFIANGSEPLILPSFKKYISYATSRIPDVALFTNGVKLTTDTSHFLIDSGLTRLNVSFDAATSSTYSRIRGGDLNYVETNLHYLLSLNQVHRSLVTRVSFCVQSDNIHEVQLFKDKWNGVVDSVEFQDLHSFDDLPSLPLLDIVSSTHLVDNHKFCYSPFSYLSIWSDGIVSPCCTFHGKKIPLGNVNSSSTTLSDLWHGISMRAIRDQFTVHKLNQVCDNCLNCTSFH